MTTDSKAPAIDATITLDTPTIGQSPNDTLTLRFANGRTLTIQVGDLSPAILAQATMHGLKQKLVDAAAISRDPATGRAATIDTKFDAVNAVLGRLCAGEWNKRREGSPTGGLLLRALVRLYPTKAREDLISFLDGKSDAEKAALRRNPKVAAVIEEIRGEDAADGAVDSDSLLGELDD